MPAKDLKSVAIAAVAAATLVALMALASPVFAAGQLMADGGVGSGGGAIDPLTGGLLLVIGGYGIWTTRPRRPKVATTFDEAKA